VWTGDSSDPTATSTCHKPVHGNSGDACIGDCPSNSQDCSFDLLTSPGPIDSVCFEADGLYCNSTGASPVCSPRVANGASCAADSTACASSSYCDSSGATPTCKAAGTLGQSCSNTGSQCQAQYVCGTDTKCDDPGFAFDSTCAGNPPVPY
jgi:hypothetical protein